MSASLEPTALPPALRRGRDAAVAVALLAAATLLNLALDRHSSLTGEAMLYVLAVAVSSYTVSRTAAVLTAAGAAALLNLLFINPRYTFRVDSQENVTALLAMLGVALVISHLAAVSRRETEAARLNERRARQLQELASALAGASTPAGVRELAQRSLSRAFPGPCLVALVGPDGKLLVPEGPLELGDGLLACIREAAPLGPGTGRWPALNAWYLPLRSERHIGGAARVGNVSALEQPPIVALREVLGSDAWQARLAQLPGYEAYRSGEVLSLRQQLPWWRYARDKKRPAARASPDKTRSP